MTPGEFLLVALAGVAAGAINTVVGSGTLITFPTLLAFGVPPVTANVSNTIGLVPGSVTGAVGYRSELRGAGSLVRRLAGASLIGGLGGGLLLIWKPGAFESIVPFLVALGIVLVATGPRISAWVARRHADTGGLPESGAWWVWPAMLACGVYGGYFGAAQGVLMMAVLGAGVPHTLQRLNGVKNILAALVNAGAGLLFVLVAEVDWRGGLVVGGGSVVRGVLGASVGRRLSDVALRVIIIVVGCSALAVFLFG